jgi:hypothetical protein
MWNINDLKEGWIHELRSHTGGSAVYIIKNIDYEKGRIGIWNTSDDYDYGSFDVASLAKSYSEIRVLRKPDSMKETRIGHAEYLKRITIKDFKKNWLMRLTANGGYSEIYVIKDIDIVGNRVSIWNGTGEVDLGWYNVDLMISREYKSVELLSKVSSVGEPMPGIDEYMSRIGIE